MSETIKAHIRQHYQCISCYLAPSGNMTTCLYLRYSLLTLTATTRTLTTCLPDAPPPTASVVPIPGNHFAIMNIS